MGHDVDALCAAFDGRYRIEREIGSGGMATVYLAHDLRQDRDVAIKVMAPDVAAGFGVERFAREVAIAGRLAHPNIVPVFDSGTVSLGDATLPFYVMPFVPGESLRARLQRERQLPLDDALGILRDIAEALDTAHAQGVVHRDVKPENILLVSGRAMLADFGVARAAQDPHTGGRRLTSTGIAVGTPAYMSPEQSAGDPVIDGRADTYALAVTAYEMLAGETPFTGVTPQAVLARQLSGDVHPLATIRPHVVTGPMDEVFTRALSPTPADRFATTGAFVAALESGRGRRDAARGAASPAARRGRNLAVAGLAAALVVAATLSLRDTWSARARRDDGRLGVGVMPFRALAAASEWSETLPDLLSTFLDGTPGVRVADPWALWRPLRPTGDAQARSPDPQEAERIARRAGVKRYVMGAVVRSGERLDLTLRIYGIGISDPVSTFTMNGSVDSTVQLAQRTAVEVLERVWEGEGSPAVPHIESLFTQSPDALKAYLAAREAMRRGMPDSANSAITRAITLDSSFALGLLEAVMIRSWVQSTSGQLFSGLRTLGRRALANADSLTERQRLRLEATLASIETEGAVAASAWRRLLERDSTDMEASLGLTYAILAYGWQFGATLEDLGRWAEHGVRLDSTDVRALATRSAVAMARWDPGDLERQAARLRALRTQAPLARSTLRGIEALQATDAAFAARVDSLAAAPASEWVGIFRALRSYRPDRALRLAERTARGATPGPALNLGLGGMTGILLAADAARTADSVATASASPAPVRHAQRMVAAALVGIDDSASTARNVRLLSEHVTLDSALAYFDERPVWSVSWSLGTWHASRGDTALARQWAAMLARFSPGGSPAMWREALGTDIASRLAERRGDVDSARVLAARALELWSVHTENISDADPEPALRFRHARFLFEAGMKDSAARILRSFIPPTSWIGSYVPHAHLLLGRIAEERGEREVAARHYDEARQLLALGGNTASALRSAADSDARRFAGVSLYRYGRER